MSRSRTEWILLDRLGTGVVAMTESAATQNRHSVHNMLLCRNVFNFICKSYFTQFTQILRHISRVGIKVKSRSRSWVPNQIMRTVQYICIYNKLRKQNRPLEIYRTKNTKQKLIRCLILISMDSGKLLERLHGLYPTNTDK